VSLAGFVVAPTSTRPTMASRATMATASLSAVL